MDDIVEIKEKVDAIYEFCENLSKFFAEFAQSSQGQMMARMTGMNFTGMNLSKIGQ